MATTTSTPTRSSKRNVEKLVCELGAKCTRKNPLHLKEYSHPSTDDNDAVDAKIDNNNDDNETSSESAEDVKVKKATRSVPARKAAAASSTSASSLWTKEDTCLVRVDPNAVASDRVYGFDLDSTLIVTASGKTFATSRDDWALFDSAVADVLRKLHRDGYALVIFSNQSGIGGKFYDEAKARMICGKIDDVIASIGVPMHAFVATADDRFRKPATALWDLFVAQFNAGIEPNLADCHYVGDAAGRPAGWRAGAKKDFACSDRKFAHNAGLTFHTPEALFLGIPEASKFSWDGLDPRTLLARAGAGEVCDGGVESIVRKGVLELVIFVGSPASGKSTFAKTYFVPAGYAWANRDMLKTVPKVQKAVRDALSAGQSVVLDNTSPKAATRAEYIAIARQFGARVRCFRFVADRELCSFLNMYRERLTKGEHKHVPRIAFNTFHSQLEEPTVGEGDRKSVV